MTKEFQEYVEENNLDKELMEECGKILVDKFLFLKKDVETVHDIYNLVLKYKN